jgi:hypothetical protein
MYWQIGHMEPMVSYHVPTALSYPVKPEHDMSPHAAVLAANRNGRSRTGRYTHTRR